MLGQVLRKSSQALIGQDMVVLEIGEQSGELCVFWQFLGQSCQARIVALIAAVLGKH